MENKEKTALIIGQHGMDATLMYDLLKSKGYDVVSIPGRSKWDQLASSIGFLRPKEIYNFSGVSDTFKPFDAVSDNIEANLTLPANILDIICKVDPTIKFFNASSCLIFGKDTSGLQNENTPINPSHPYGIIKNAATQLVKMYREEKGLFACSAIYFPHEHPKRGSQFFTKKICSAVARIKMGSEEKITVGDLKQWRDWTWAPDAVEAAYMMLQHHTPTDFVVGTGVPITTGRFIQLTFDYAGIVNWEQYIDSKEDLVRNNDIKVLQADISKIKKELGWKPKHDIYFIIKSMIDHELEQLKQNV